LSESYIQLPPDSTGKKVRAISKTISGQTVYEEIQGIDKFPNRVIVGKYIVATPAVTGTTTANYVYATLFNPATSNVYIAVKKIYPLVFAAAAAVYIQVSVFRITSATGGTLLASTAIAKKDTQFPSPKAEVRYAGVTVSNTGARITSFISPGAAGYVHFLGGMIEFNDYDELILRPGEGIALIQEAAGDTDFRVILIVEWDEFTGSIWI